MAPFVCFFVCEFQRNYVGRGITNIKKMYMCTYLFILLLTKSEGLQIPSVVHFFNTSFSCLPLEFPKLPVAHGAVSAHRSSCIQYYELYYYYLHFYFKIT